VNPEDLPERQTQATGLIYVVDFFGGIPCPWGSTVQGRVRPGGSLVIP
jgi:hypothetical protein